MNMNNDPKREELAALIRNCDDTAGAHILWVDRLGEVRITLIKNETPASWVKRMDDKIKFRYESYGANNDYVGDNAANDIEYVSSLYNELLKDWDDSNKDIEEGYSASGTNKMIGHLMTIELEKRQSITPYLDDVLDNLLRVAHLLTLYKTLQEKEEFSELSATNDILRISVVFVHSTLEEFLRRLAIDLLPNASEKALNKIPLNTEAVRAEKFMLGNLAKFKQNTVEEVIKKSVINYYERSNFNNIDEISTLFSDLGLDVTKVRVYLPKLEELMKRRHFIVHRGDKMRKPHESLAPLSPITSKEVNEWLNIVTKFCGDVFEDAIEKNLFS